MMFTRPKVGNDVAASSQTSPTHTCHVKALMGFKDFKSVNLEYNTLVCWANGTKVLSTKRLMFQELFFFHKILQISLQKPFQFFFSFLYKITKMKMKSFECPKSIKSINKIILGTSDTWSTIRLSRCPSNPA